MHVCCTTLQQKVYGELGRFLVTGENRKHATFQKDEEDLGKYRPLAGGMRSQPSKSKLCLMNLVAFCYEITGSRRVYLDNI